MFMTTVVEIALIINFILHEENPKVQFDDAVMYVFIAVYFGSHG